MLTSKKRTENIRRYRLSRRLIWPLRSKLRKKRNAVRERRCNTNSK